METSNISRLEDSDWINIIKIKKGQMYSLYKCGNLNVHFPLTGYFK